MDLLNEQTKIKFQLNKFPKDEKRLKNIEKLNLFWCKLKHLPSEFINLQKLERLKLYGNKIQEFPKVINKLKNLKECDIKKADFPSKYEIK